MYCGPYSDNLSTFTLLKQIAQIPQNLLLARVNSSERQRLVKFLGKRQGDGTSALPAYESFAAQHGFELHKVLIMDQDVKECYTWNQIKDNFAGFEYAGLERQFKGRGTFTKGKYGKQHSVRFSPDYWKRKEEGCVVHPDSS